MLKIENLQKEINKNLDYIKSLRPLKTQELNELRKSLWVIYTYNSNAIEWNTISLWETKLLLEDWITVWWKTIKELNETINHKELLNFLYYFLEKDQKIDENLIKQVHKLVMKNIDENAWEYRKIQVYITWEEKLPTNAKNIEKEIKNLLNSYEKGLWKRDISILASEFHYDFVKIHPFIDWNGRTIRLLLNMILMKAWFPMIVLPVIRRQEYINSLNSSSKKENFIIFILDVINQNLEDYIRMIDYNS